MKIFYSGFAVLLICSAMAACDQPSAVNNENVNNNSSTSNIPENMHFVDPVKSDHQPKRQNDAAPKIIPAELKIGQGQFFSYALPQGWRLGEDGQFALSLAAPDNLAFTVMVGNSGLMPDYPPAQFIREKMMALRPANLQIGQGQQTDPVHGFQYAYSFPVSYQANGNAYRGVATCHVYSYYGGCVMAMTAAISENSQWSSYASWLPAVSRQIAATNGGAFGMRGMMQQNLRNSTAYAAAAKEYRDWSAKKQQETTDYRNEINDKQNEQFRDNIGGVQRYHDANGNEVQLSTQYQYYWTDNNGKILGTNDANAEPGGNWSRMKTKEQ